MSEAEWVESRITELLGEHGAVPPPWFAFPDTHPYSICWRMGTGESHVMVFNAWWDRRKIDLSESQRVAYFRKWPPPPRWLTWMIDVIWDLRPWELDDPDAFDYSPYFDKVERLGFGSEADFDRDMNDPKWLDDDS